ncbi:MAG: sulfatase-like hydrolase/transferase [Salinibacter sp.]|uniref:sulfatase-like hydrolase/transferase n=1 Tax=Salinibacter sp. TaxID=2065818 RepID=UPI002FC2D99D
MQLRSRVRTTFTHLPWIWGVLFVALAAGRAVEYGYVWAHHSLSVSLWRYELVGLLHDLDASLSLGLVLGVFFFAGTFVGRRVAVWSTAGLTAVVAVLHLALIRYFARTLQPLEADLWAYEVTEVLDTVRASGSSDFWFWGLALLLAGGVAGLAWATRQRDAPAAAGMAVAVLMVGSVFASAPRSAPARPAAEHLAPNKTAYFIGHTLALFFDQAASAPDPPDGTEPEAASPTAAPHAEYPWMYRAQYDDVLGPFFEESMPSRDAPPNLVFIVFEGLGKDFVGEDATYGGFTPFVDSLAQQGLYWKNFLSTTGRTFGLMPSLFGSLPYAERGFMAMGDQMPRHQTLPGFLGERGYFTSYYSGFFTPFDNVDRFLGRQDFDRVVERNRLNQLFGDDPGGETRYWGYPDKQMFERASAMIDTTARTPRLEIFHTLQTHDPFAVPDDARYRRRFEQRFRALNPGPDAQSRYRTYRSELTTFLYTDEAIRQFFRDYRQRPEFGNTIFVITGDHRLIPIPQPSQIARYHVPLIIYSPLLKRRATFASVSTHADVVPTLLAFLQNEHDVPLPDRAHWLGTKIDTARQFRNVHSMPLMRNKNQLIDYLHGDAYLAGEQLYRLGPGLSLTPQDAPDRRTDLQRRLARFKRTNQYVTQNDRLFGPDVPLAELPPTTPFRAASWPSPRSTPSARRDSILADLEARALNTSEQFQRARQLAFDGEYEVARIIARRLLDRNPDFHDVRTLLGRTYSWSRQLDAARGHFEEVLRRDSSYVDAYAALADAELWAGRAGGALDVVNEGLSVHPEHPELLARKVRALVALGRRTAAATALSTLERVAPDHDQVDALTQSLDS